jgi:hypothetical protein
VVVFLLLFATWVELPPKGEEYQLGWGTAFGPNYRLLGTFHILFFLPAALLALASPLVPYFSIQLPPWARDLWPWRSGILAGITLVSFMFFFLELITGFGLEHAHAGTDLYYQLRRTWWVDWVFWLQLAAIVGSALDFWLVLRKNRPWPQIEISW